MEDRKSSSSEPLLDSRDSRPAFYSNDETMLPDRPRLRTTESTFMANYVKQSHRDDEMDENTWLFELTVNLRKLRKGKINLRPLLRRTEESWRRYTMEMFKSDMAVGITLAGLLLPQAVAYSSIASIPPRYGLYTGFIPYIIFGIFGTDIYVSYGPFALMSLLMSNALTEAGFTGCSSSSECNNPSPETQDYVDAAITLSFLVGLTYWIMAAIRLTQFSTLLADPVMSGYVTAAGLLIGASQMKHFLQLDIPSDATFIEVLDYCVKHTGQINWYQAFVTVISFGMIYGFKYVNHAIPYLEHNNITLPVHLFTMIVWILVTWQARLDEGEWNLDIVGTIPSGFPPLSTPRWGYIGKLIVPSLSVSLVGFILGMGVIKTFASKYNYKERVGKQVASMGLANVVGSFFSCYPACASLTRAAVIDSIGPATTLHDIISAVLLMIVMLSATSLFHFLPEATLTAIVFSTIVRLLDFEKPVELYHLDLKDFFIWVSAFLSTLFGGITVGIVVSVCLSLLLLLLESARPAFSILGKVPNTSIYRDTKYYHNLEQVPDVLVISFGSSLNFSNKDFFEKRVRTSIDRYEAAVSPNTSSMMDVEEDHQITITKSTAYIFDLLRAAARTESTNQQPEAKTRAEQSQLTDSAASSTEPITLSSLAPPVVRWLVLDCSSMHNLDYSAAKMLQTLIRALSPNWCIMFCNCSFAFRSALDRLKVQDALKAHKGYIGTTIDAGIDSITANRRPIN